MSLCLAAAARLQAVRKVAVQVLSALAFLQEEGIVHGDLKPENLLLVTGKKHRKPMAAQA